MICGGCHRESSSSSIKPKRRRRVHFLTKTLIGKKIGLKSNFLEGPKFYFQVTIHLSYCFKNCFELHGNASLFFSVQTPLRGQGAKCTKIHICQIVLRNIQGVKIRLHFHFVLVKKKFECWRYRRIFSKLYFSYLGRWKKMLKWLNLSRRHTLLMSLFFNI